MTWGRMAGFAFSRMAIGWQPTMAEFCVSCHADARGAFWQGYKPTRPIQAISLHFKKQRHARMRQNQRVRNFPCKCISSRWRRILVEMWRKYWHFTDESTENAIHGPLESSNCSGQKNIFWLT